MTHEQRIVAFLSQASSYPHPVEAVERRETHVSHVFLAGEFAYKLKKPVTFPFLDAAALEARERFCRLELSLNRRLAPAVYLGMVPVIEEAGRLRLGPCCDLQDAPQRAEGAVVEWLVFMRRLPEARMLDRLVARGRVRPQDMDQIADRLAGFFRRAGRSGAIDRYGEPAQVAALVLTNLAECRPFVGALFSETDRERLEAAFRQYLTLHEPWLVRRLRRGRIIDGHGDLRCENICLADPVAIFDCVEFQPAFRCGDMANDLAFLVMDLEFRGRADLARRLMARYRRARLDDRTLDTVLPLYQCHRTLVRGKVRGFAWQQHPDTAAGRRIKALARGHFRLARQYARRFAPPRLVVVGGLIGTGKSTLAKALAQALGAVWLRTDEIRLTEFADRRRHDQGFAGGLYAPRVSAQVYRRLMQRAGRLIRQGVSVVCDGTFSQAAGREALRAAARRHQASFHFFECAVPRAVALRRIAKRHADRSDISEARPEHYDRLKAGFEPVRGWPSTEWTRLSDDRPAARTCEAALKVLRRAWLPQ